MQKYSAPLPTNFVATTANLSKNQLKVLKLQEEFGFEYASVVEMLIYLMNTTFFLHFSIIKLANFTNLPGPKHFRAVKHIPHYQRCR